MKPHWIATLGLFLVPGCGEYDCEELCEDLNDCGEDQRCSEAECPANDAFNAKSGCDGAYGDMLSCLDDHPEAVCDYEQGCSGESRAYLRCVNSYCSANPTECPAP